MEIESASASAAVWRRLHARLHQRSECQIRWKMTMQIVLGSSKRWSPQREEADFHHGRSCESTHAVPLEVQVESNSSCADGMRQTLKRRSSDLSSSMGMALSKEYSGTLSSSQVGNSFTFWLYRLWNRAMDALFHRRKWASYGSMGMGIGPQSRQKTSSDFWLSKPRTNRSKF